MGVHNELGVTGEKMARTWLEEKGYTILHQNWRYKQYEIDIVATRGKFLHFVEVKARQGKQIGNPEDAVTKKKFKNLRRAADEYLFLNPGHHWIQYDILSISLHNEAAADYFFIEDVYL